MFHGTTYNDDFKRNAVLQCWSNVAAIRSNVKAMLQRCVALKIVVVYPLVWRHL